MEGIPMPEKSINDSSSIIDKKRLEFLFDGIFAISMTILVLDLKAPDLSDRHSVSELGKFLLYHKVSFISYILSFIMLGMFWYNHNNYYRYFYRITNGMFGLTLVQLSVAAFFPFCAALFGRYPINRLSIVIYLGCIAVYLWTSAIQWLLAKRQSALMPKLDPSIYRRIRKKSIIGSIFCTFLFLSYLLNALIG
jgi:uncharacterized membrane protein